VKQDNDPGYTPGSNASGGSTAGERRDLVGQGGPGGNKVEQLAERLRLAERRARLALVVATVLAVALLGSVVMMILSGQEREPTVSPVSSGTASDNPLAPAGAQDDGGILLGSDLTPGGEAPTADQAVTVRIFTDFLCPYCNLIEQAQGAALAEAAQAGQIRLVIHPVNYLTGFNADYSKRALLAAETVAALEPARFWAFYEALWANQPAESQTSSDLTDEAIAQLALGAQVSQSTVDLFSDPPVAQWASWSEAEGRKLIRGTPTVLLSFAGSEPVAWNEWVMSGVDADGQSVWIPGDLSQALAKVRNGEDPNASPPADG
jgi:protein-disulfide isomerase